MARLFPNVTLDALKLSSAVVTTTPVSMACFFYRPTGYDTWSGIMSIAQDGSNEHRHTMNIVDQANGGYVTAQTRSTGNSIAQTTTGCSLNAWHHAAAVFATASSRSAYLDGGSKGTNTGNRTPTAGLLNSTWIASASGLASYAGIVAEAAMWNVALSDTEVALLASGVSPLRIRRANLLFYLPVAGVSDPETDLSGNGRNFSVIGSPTVADHPPVMPRFWLFQPEAFVTAAGGNTYNETVSLGRSASVAAGASVEAAETVSLARGASASLPTGIDASASASLARAGAVTVTETGDVTGTLSLGASRAVTTTESLQGGVDESVTLARAASVSVADAAGLSGALSLDQGRGVVLSTNAAQSAAVGLSRAAGVSASPGAQTVDESLALAAGFGMTASAAGLVAAGAISLARQADLVSGVSLAVDDSLALARAGALAQVYSVIFAGQVIGLVDLSLYERDQDLTLRERGTERTLNPRSQELTLKERP